MRSIAEIDADIAEVQNRIAARNAGTPQRNTPEYRAARFDYIVDGDRSGLDAYQNALNAAIQNKLSRESAEKMAKSGKAQASLEEDDDIMLHLGDAGAVVDDLKKRNYSDDSVEMKKAKNMLEYWTKRAARKGLDVSSYMETPKVATVPSNTPAPAQDNVAPKARTYEQIAEDIARLANDKEATLERVNELEGELDSVADSVPYGKVTESKNLLNSKKAELATGRWNEYNSRVKAALGEKNYEKRKAALEPLKEELPNYKGQEKYAEVEKSINDGLKKPAPDPLTKGVVRQNFGKSNVITMMKELKNSKEKGITKNISVGGKGRTVTFKLLQNGDVQVLNEKGKEIDRFKQADLVEFDTGNKVEVPPPQKVNPVARALGGGTGFPNGRVIVGPGEDW